jgi:hypothetical protein
MYAKISIFLGSLNFTGGDRKGACFKQKIRLIPRGKNSNNSGNQMNFLKRVLFFLPHTVY